MLTDQTHTNYRIKSAVFGYRLSFGSQYNQLVAVKDKLKKESKEWSWIENGLFFVNSWCCLLTSVWIEIRLSVT